MAQLISKIVVELEESAKAQLNSITKLLSDLLTKLPALEVEIEKLKAQQDKQGKNNANKSTNV